MLSGMFHLIQLYQWSQIPKRKAFLPNQVFEAIFDIREEKIQFVPFILLKTTILNSGSQCKNWFENDPSGPSYLRKHSLGRRFGLACHFYKYFGLGWFVFYIDF